MERLLSQSSKPRKAETGSHAMPATGTDSQEGEPRVGEGEKEGEAAMEGEAEVEGEGARDKEKEREKQKQADAVDGRWAAGRAVNHKGEKHRFRTVGYQKSRVHKKIPEFATQRQGMSKPRTALHNVLFSQGDKIPELEALRDRLGSFSMLGLPRLPEQLRSHWEVGGVKGEETLEYSWTNIVHNHTSLSRSCRLQQEALWELIQTELNYLRSLRVITDLVIAALLNLHQSGFLLDVRPDFLFSNVPSLLRAHCQFWQEVILPLLQEVRSTGRPLDPLRLWRGFKTFSSRFQCYMQYCSEEEALGEFTRSQTSSNPHFHMFLTWVETHRLCGRMRVGDMQARPHQRITKYPLLLQAVRSWTEHTGTAQALTDMLVSVNSFLAAVNTYLQTRADQSSLRETAQRIEGYQLLEGGGEELDRQLRKFCQIDLTSPIVGAGPNDIRKLLLEETLKIRDKKDSKVELSVLLFSDVLLLCRSHRKSDRLRVTRPPLHLHRVHCRPLRDPCSFLCVEVSELGCAVNVYTLYTSTPEACADWLAAIHTTQESLAEMHEREALRKMREYRHTDQHRGPVIHSNLPQPGLGQSESRDFLSQEIGSPLENSLHHRAELSWPSQSEAGLLLPSTTRSLTRGDPTMELGDPAGSQWEYNYEEGVRTWIRGSNNSQWEGREIVLSGGQERRVTWNSNSTGLQGYRSAGQSEAEDSPSPSLNDQLESGGSQWEVGASQSREEGGSQKGSFRRSPGLRRRRPLTSQQSPFLLPSLTSELQRRRGEAGHHRFTGFEAVHQVPNSNSNSDSDSSLRRTHRGGLFLQAPDRNSHRALGERERDAEGEGSLGVPAGPPGKVPECRKEGSGWKDSRGLPLETPVSGNPSADTRLLEKVPKPRTSDRQAAEMFLTKASIPRTPKRETGGGGRLPEIVPQRSASSSDIVAQGASDGISAAQTWNSEENVNSTEREREREERTRGRGRKERGSEGEERILSLELLLRRAQTREREREQDGGRERERVGERGQRQKEGEWESTSEERGRRRRREVAGGEVERDGVWGQEREAWEEEGEGRRDRERDFSSSASSSPSPSFSSSDGERVEEEEEEEEDRDGGEDLEFIRGYAHRGAPEWRDEEKKRRYSSEAGSDWLGCDEVFIRLVPDSTGPDDVLDRPPKEGGARMGRRLTISELQRIRSRSRRSSREGEGLDCSAANDL
ncbi:uncharacterized protein plekhg6 [Amia ocellicauda]|uniref:uncharacterized protein plekhg6 n=1 Tax=Amia ocellicauda TaxID=2972642 RepID=UPI003464A0F1